LRVRLGQRSAKDGEVLGEQIDSPAIDRAPTGHNPVTGDFRFFHSEFVGPMFDEHVELLERTLIEQKLDTFPRGELSARVLGLDPRLATAEAGLLAALLEFIEDVFHGPLPRLARESRKPYHTTAAAPAKAGIRHGFRP